MENGIIFDIKKFSIHDGPGIRTTVFLKGCPLSCGWCHNPESQRVFKEKLFAAGRCIGCRACLAACPAMAIRQTTDGMATDPEKCLHCGLCSEVCPAQACEMAGREVTVREVMDDIEKDMAFFDESGGGVTFSGGEPLSQPEFLLSLLEACRERRIHTVVDTSGFSPWHVLDCILCYVDLFLFDLKLMDDDRHRQFTGVSNRRILENLQALSAGGHPLRIRIPIIPGVTDDDDNMTAIGDFVAGLPSTPPIDVLPYHHFAAAKYERLGKDYHFKKIDPPSADTLYRLTALLSGKGLTVHIDRS